MFDSIWTEITGFFTPERFQTLVVVVVNNRAVTLYELKQIYRARSTELYQKFSGEELQQKLAVLKEDVIKEKTEEQLLLEKAELEGITISDEQMDNYLKGLMEENNIENMEQFENVLQQSIGMTVDEFRESQRTQNIARSVIQQQVISKISAISVPLYLISSVSRLKRFPLHSSHVT